MGVAYAACGDGVWVGNAEMCDQRRRQFDLTIHVHHERSPTPGRCKAFDSGAGGEITKDLFVRYVDGSSLSTAEIYTGAPQSFVQGAPALQTIAAFARRDGRILCHCAAGLCRGPTMAILAKIARGCTPWQAMHDVSQAMWLGYQQSPMLFREPLTEICRWYWDGAQA